MFSSQQTPAGLSVTCSLQPEVAASPAMGIKAACLCTAMVERMGAAAEPVPEEKLRSVWEVVLNALGGAGTSLDLDDLYEKEYVAARGSQLLLGPPMTAALDPNRRSDEDKTLQDEEAAQLEGEQLTPRLSPAQAALKAAGLESTPPRQPQRAREAQEEPQQEPQQPAQENNAGPSNMCKGRATGCGLAGQEGTAKSARTDSVRRLSAAMGVIGCSNVHSRR